MPFCVSVTMTRLPTLKDHHQQHQPPHSASFNGTFDVWKKKLFSEDKIPICIIYTFSLSTDCLRIELNKNDVSWRLCDRLTQLLSNVTRAFNDDFPSFLKIKMDQPQHLFVYFVIFNNNLYRKIVDFSGIWTRIVGAEGEHAYHLTTTTAHIFLNWAIVETSIKRLHFEIKTFFRCRESNPG